MVNIGIDLGTTNCCISVIKNGKAEVIEDAEGKRTTPSYIHFAENETVFGGVAFRKCGYRPEYTVYDVKRFLGKRLSDPTLEQMKRNWCFKMIESDGKLKVSVGGRLLEPEQLSGMLLKALNQRAKERLMVDKIKRAVITVPTYFDQAQRQATIDAGKLGGFEEVKLLTEPTAAAIAYNVNRYYSDVGTNLLKTVFVFDFGGGTFDVSIVKMRQGSVKVLAIDGDVNLGGNDITLNLLNYMSQLVPNMQERIEYINEHEFDIKDEKFLNNYRYYRRLLGQCEEWKKELSNTTDTEVDFDQIQMELSRHTFEEINEDIFSRVIKIVKNCLNRIKLSPCKIDEVLLIGGSSKIPILREKLEEIFGKKLSQGIHPEEAVSAGAAIVASKWEGSKEFADFNFVDICPYNLGVETKGHAMNVIIPKHTPLPATFTKTFTTSVDLQATIKVNIYSGDEKSVLKNTFLGSLTVTGFPLGPAASIKVDETFMYDENGILQVEVVERNVGKPLKMKITLDKGNSQGDNETYGTLRSPVPARIAYYNK